MTIEKSRELLGVEAENLSDEEVANLNHQTQQMCEALLKIIVSTSPTYSKNSLTSTEERDKNGL